MYKVAIILLAFTAVHCGRNDDNSQLKTLGTPPLPGPNDAATDCGPQTAEAYDAAQLSSPSSNRGNREPRNTPGTAEETYEDQEQQPSPYNGPAITGEYSEIALTSDVRTAEPCRDQNGHVGAAGDRTRWAEENATLDPLSVPSIASNADGVASSSSVVPEPETGAINSSLDIDYTPTAKEKSGNRTRGTGVLSDCPATALALLDRYDFIDDEDAGDCEADQ